MTEGELAESRNLRRSVGSREKYWFPTLILTGKSSQQSNLKWVSRYISLYLDISRSIDPVFRTLCSQALQSFSRLMAGFLSPGVLPANAAEFELQGIKVNQLDG